jgi:sigma-E factor negative regulatory protein RseB
VTARPAEPRASRRRPSRSAPLCALALLAAGWLDLAWGNEAAQALLERMSQAAHTLNYDGTFMYHKDGVMESMRIIHRAEQNGAERERLISLNGVPREVLRDSDVVRCILPDDESVVIARAGSAAVPRQPRVLGRAGGSTHYRFSAGSGERIAGRTTRTIVIEPADEYRYGYRLWLDEQTSLLLRSDVYDPWAGTL